VTIPLLLVMVGSFALVGGTAPAVDPGTPVHVPANLDARERAYFDVVAPRFQALVAETDGLATLGRARSRESGPLLEGQAHVQTLIREIEIYRDRNGVPERYAESDRRFREGRDHALGSIRAARSALLRFDWDALGASVDRLDRAGAAFRAADDGLRETARILPAQSVGGPVTRGVRGGGTRRRAARLARRRAAPIVRAPYPTTSML